MRIRTILTAAAAPAALAAVLLGTAGAASAATVPNPNSVITIRSQADADNLPGVVNKNIVVASDATYDHAGDGSVKPIWIAWRTINGNIADNGQLTLASDNVFGNVTVTGPGSYLDFGNQASHVHGNVNVTGSSGQYVGAQANVSLDNHVQYPGADLPPLPGTGTDPQTNPARGQIQVDGGLNFTGNTSMPRIQYPMHVNGKFVYSGNTVTSNPWSPWGGAPIPFDQSWVSGLTHDGGQFVS